jgi:IclR family transcriptional regulator, KDG regulon repressor
MSEIQTLARGLVVLERLAETPDGLGITELADEFGVDKGNMSRLLKTLASYGFAQKDEGSRKYTLGPQIVRLSRIVLTRMPLRETAKPSLKELVAATGECAHLAIAVQGQALYIDQEESPSSLRVTTGVGTLAPLYCTALGKVLLSFAHTPLPDKLQAYTARTITDPVMLQHHLEVVRNQGYAVDDEEYEVGVRCIAVPVYDYRDKCVAAIGISGPTSRLTLDILPRVTQVVQDIGKTLSSRLSFKLDQA